MGEQGYLASMRRHVSITGAALLLLLALSLSIARDASAEVDAYDGEEDGQEPLDPSERSLKSMPYMGDKFSTRGDYTEGMTMLSRFKDSHEYLYKLAPLRCKYRHQLGLGSTTPLPTRDHGYGSGEATPYEAGGGGGGGGSGSMGAQSGKDAGRRRGKGHKGHHHTAPANFATSRVSVCWWVGERAGVYVG